MTRQHTSKRRRTVSPVPCVSLPDDLITDVLLRLPARTLARFRCVSRSWNTEISSRSFKMQHHELATGAFPKFAFLPIAKKRCHSGPNYWQNCKSGCPRIVSAKPCHGVVLVERRCDRSSYSVCNPSTGGALHLPPLHEDGPVDLSSGIGFDAATGEHKVVNLTVDIDAGAGCQVLAVGSNSAGLVWRPPAAGLQFLLDCHERFVDDDVDPVFADGCLHWMCKTHVWDFDKPHGILSFSLAEESFRRAPQPPFATADVVPHDHTLVGDRRPSVGHLSSDTGELVTTPLGRALAELDGSLCMVRDVRRRDGVDRLFEIWRLRDYETGSWTMDYSISMTGRVARQLTKPWLVVPVCHIGASDDAMATSRRKIVLGTSEHDALVYDPSTNALDTVASRTVRTPSVREFVGRSWRSFKICSQFLRLVPYQESLVQFAGMEHRRRQIRFVKLM